MKLEMVATDGCGGGTCPTIYISDRGTVVVQGNRVSDSVGFDIPANEVLAEVPLALIEELVRSGRVS